MEFNLFCEDKIIESNILSLGMFGQMIGACLGLYLQTSMKKTKTI